MLVFYVSPGSGNPKMVELSITIGDQSVDLEECRYVYFYEYSYVHVGRGIWEN